MDDDVKRIIEFALDDDFITIMVILPFAGTYNLPDLGVRKPFEKIQLLDGDKLLLLGNIFLRSLKQ